jgi:tetratricopeptide (TPR) repeat protein
MPGEGSMMHMIITLRNNKKLLRKKGMFKKERSFLQSDKSNYAAPSTGIPSEEVAPEQLEKIRSKVIGERKRRNLQFTIFLCVILPILGFLGYLVLHNFSFGFDTLQNYGTEQVKSKVSLVKKNKTYLFYLNDGDARLKKHQYHNAIFQYKKALEVFPSEFDAQYRLALAYSYQCQYKF